jgi:glycosyltransferase involved in cell wall biosynthesis
MHVAFRHSFVQDIGSSAKLGRDTSYAALSDTPFQIIMATRFHDYQKRQDILIQAAAQLPKDRAIEITLIGDGVNKSDMIALAADLGVTDRVKFVAFQSQQMLWEQLERVNLLCHSVDYEGLGKIIIESMALGLPVLASDVAPLNSYIRDGENGFLATNHPAAWADKICQLIDDPSALARVSEASMAYIRAHYDPDENVKAYERQFEAIVGGA